MVQEHSEKHVLGHPSRSLNPRELYDGNQVRDQILFLPSRFILTEIPLYDIITHQRRPRFDG